MDPPTRAEGRLVPWIGAFKLVKAVLLVAVAVGVLRLVHRDVATTLTDWIQDLGVDPNGRYVRGLLTRATRLDGRHLQRLGVGTLIYASLFVVEGVGLMLRRRWAEWVTIVITGSFVPLEIHGLVRHFSAVKVGVIALNVAVVAYLVAKVWPPSTRGGRSGRTVVPAVSP